MLAAALLQGNAPLALATAPLVGALLAFLRYNFNPASIFLGDSGSLTIGFMLGCFGAIWSQKSATLARHDGAVDGAGDSTARHLAVGDPPLPETPVDLHARPQPHPPPAARTRFQSPAGGAGAVCAPADWPPLFSLLQAMPSQRFGSLLLVVFCVVLTTGAKLIGYMEFYTARQLLQTGSFRSIVSATMFVSAIRPKVAKCVVAEDYWAVVREVRQRTGVHARADVAGGFHVRGARRVWRWRYALRHAHRPAEPRLHELRPPHALLRPAGDHAEHRRHDRATRAGTSGNPSVCRCSQFDEPGGAVPVVSASRSVVTESS